MEVVCSSETLVDFQRTTWNYIQKNILHNHRCEKVKIFITDFSDVRHNIDGHKQKQILF
jgi:tRNA1(Val) A37 N6-methylase TrmN6